ncbi:MAG: aldehyde dehydrogenase family protein, partial [Sphingomonadales bacterium]|nr:aldehyde dehydrogenase family protein [Sphingomonadales bacterium]
MAEHFVLGSSIETALSRGERNGALHSFDMLGEGACTHADAQRYFDAYCHAARSIGASSRKRGSAGENGLSIKLSALHPEYSWAKRRECVPALISRIVALAEIARSNGIGITIDGEEADRLEISLLIFDELITHPVLDGWDGLGIVVQAYGRRASAAIDHITMATRAAGRRIAVRLVKGAYWDAEIKRAQAMGLDSYPVFTRKEHTDISYLACARQLMNATDVVYPQFATHNAHTAAAICAMAQPGSAFEFQRLHGMGEALHHRIAAATGIASRVYAPVGRHKELLPYLVRRLLENGANSSFVNQLMNPDLPIDDLVRDPIVTARQHGFSPNPAIPAPRDMFGGTRQLAHGMDVTQAHVAQFAETLPGAVADLQAGQAGSGTVMPVHNPARHGDIVGHVIGATPADVDAAIARAAASRWGGETCPLQRSAILHRIADALEAQMPQLMGICVREAGKSLPDAVDEVREAEGQAEMGGQCRAVVARSQQPDVGRRLAGRLGHDSGAFMVQRQRVVQPGDEVAHLVGILLGIAPVGLAVGQDAHRVLVAARGTTDADVDAAGKKSLQHAEVLGHL